MSDDASDVDVLLHLVREQLGMDVAFVTRFDGSHREFRNIDSGIGTGGIAPGFVDEREHTFCQYIVDERIGQVTPDALTLDLVRDLPQTRAFGIRSYIGVPLTLADGQVYGTLCAFSQEANSALGESDAVVLRALAPVLMGIIGREDTERHALAEKSRSLQGLYDTGGPSSVFQPVVELDTLQVVGWEALSRFPGQTLSPAQWFSAAAAIGQTAALERSAIRAAVDAFDSPEGFLALNASEETIVSSEFSALFVDVPLARVVIEITEHHAIADYPRLHAALTELRQGGARVAVDDAGAGYSTFQHILVLEPDLIKLDISLIRSIDRDHRRQALASAIASFAAKTDSRVIAEGIETAEELACLRRLDIHLGQGYHLGRPGPLPAPSTSTTSLAAG